MAGQREGRVGRERAREALDTSLVLGATTLFPATLEISKTPGSKWRRHRLARFAITTPRDLFDGTIFNRGVNCASLQSSSTSFPVDFYIASIVRKETGKLVTRKD